MEPPAAGPSDTTFAEMMALEAHGPDTFVGVGPSYPWGGLYGGQIAAQSLRAAGLTVDGDLRPHSLHGYFIRRGDASEPIRFEVDRIRNGRSFATRRVVARQSGGAIFNLGASFHVREEEVDVQTVEADPSIPGPEGLESDSWSHVFERSMIWGHGTRAPADGPGRSAGWMRIVEELDDDPLTRACALTYISDDLPTEACIQDHPALDLVKEEGDWERTFMTASLDHAIWFHVDADPTQWQLHDFRDERLRGGRGLAKGHVLTTEGLHVATVTQEVLLRRVKPR